MAKAWFTPKRYGYGSGLPCSWEGWLVLAVYLIAVPLGVVPALRYLPHWAAMAVWFAYVAVLTIAFILIAKARTEGGWRWRDGSE
jgi:ABC-type microcin C transport system permease subunit YejB